MSSFVSAYRKHYSTQHVLLRLIEEWRENLDNDLIVGAILMDLSKAFDCIPHDLLIAKLWAFGFNMNSLCFMYSYLNQRKQCVKINDTNSSFSEIISGVPQGSILGPLLFNIFINDLFYFIYDATLHNFADDNTISAASKTVSDLIETLQKATKSAIDWFKYNNMIVNPEKFQALLISKSKRENLPRALSLENKTVNVLDSVKLLGITIDDSLSFNQHISTFCRSAANQLNALIRLRSFLGFNEKKVLLNSFIYSNFNYCPLVWMLSHAKSLNKIDNLQKRALQFLYNDFDASYEELLLKAGKLKIREANLMILCVEIFKTINKLNPQFMEHIFKTSVSLRPTRRQYQLNLSVPTYNTAKFGEKSLKVQGPRIWNSLPFHIKSAENLKTFKKMIKNWNGSKCVCSICRF